MNGCHSRKRPKCTRSHTRCSSLPGAAASATCRASSMASTTQRRWVAMRAARRCAAEEEEKKAIEPVEMPTRGVGTADRSTLSAPLEKSSESRIILRNNILLLVARGLQYLCHSQGNYPEKRK